MMAVVPTFGHLAAAAQDLEDSLGNIRLIADLLLRENEALPEPMRREYLGALAEKASRLQGVAEDMTALAKIHARQVTLERCPLRASEIVHQSIEASGTEAARRQITLSSTVAPQEPLIAGDYWKLSRAFQGVLESLIRGTPPDGSVAVHVERDADGVKVAFRRSGTLAALNPAESFFQDAHPSSAAALGISLSEQLVVLHGGTLEALECEAGHTVTIRLPAFDS